MHMQHAWIERATHMHTSSHPKTHARTCVRTHAQDYLIAEGGCDVARVYGTKVTYEPIVFFSQDGIK